MTSPLPQGWSPCGTGATNNDPLVGGIIDQNIVQGTWFVIFHDEIKPIKGLPSRDAAFAALDQAIADKRAVSGETTYYVLNGHTLCYLQPGMTFYGVLAGKPGLGGHDWKNGPISVTESDTLRPATLEDFAFFRVSPKGHIA